MKFNSKEWTNYYAYLSRWEGGKSSDQSDTASTQVPNGGVHTNRGITFATFKQLAPKAGIDPDYNTFLNLTSDQASKITYQYFIESGAAKLKTPAISLLFFEIAWGSGLSNAIIHLKVALQNMGYLQAKTNTFAQNAILANKVNQKSLYTELLKVRQGFLKQIVINNPTQQKFLQGWLNRLNDFTSKNKIEIIAGGGSLLLLAATFFFTFKYLNNN